MFIYLQMTFLFKGNVWLRFWVCIRTIEREIRRLESEPHEWERKGLDAVAIIPTCLRRFFRVMDKLSYISLVSGDGSSFVSCSSELRRLPMVVTEEDGELATVSSPILSVLLICHQKVVRSHLLRLNRYQMRTSRSNNLFDYISLFFFKLFDLFQSYLMRQSGNTIIN